MQRERQPVGSDALHKHPVDSDASGFLYTGHRFSATRQFADTLYGGVDDSPHNTALTERFATSLQIWMTIAG